MFKRRVSNGTFTHLNRRSTIGKPISKMIKTGISKYDLPQIPNMEPEQDEKDDDDERVTADPMLTDKKCATKKEKLLKAHSTPSGRRPAKNPFCNFWHGYHIPLEKAAIYVLKFFITMDILDILVPHEVCLVKYFLYKEYNNEFKEHGNVFKGIQVFHLSLCLYLTFMIATFTSLVADCFYYKYGLEKFQSRVILIWLVIRVFSMTLFLVIGVFCLALVIHYGGQVVTVVFFSVLFATRTIIYVYCFCVTFTFYKAFKRGLLDPTLIWVHEYETPSHSSVSTQKSLVSAVSSDNIENIEGEGEVGRVLKRQDIPLQDRYATLSPVDSNKEIFEF